MQFESHLHFLLLLKNAYTTTAPAPEPQFWLLESLVRRRAGRPRSQQIAMKNHKVNFTVNNEDGLDRSRYLSLVLVLLLTSTLFAAHPFSGSSIPQAKRRPRVREAGINVGILPVGPLNAITDVSGVLVGHTTVLQGENIRTGVTAILPHQGNLFREKVPAAIFVGNGFGKLMGSTQVNELGEIETPILLTSTLSVPRVADALLDYMLSLPGNEDAQSVNPVVAETNDGYLNDIRGRHISREDVFNAIKSAKGGAVEEGSIGAGTGTVAFGFK
jgi:D-aminopeptidase